MTAIFFPIGCLILILLLVLIVLYTILYIAFFLFSLVYGYLYYIIISATIIYTRLDLWIVECGECTKMNIIKSVYFDEDYKNPNDEKFKSLKYFYVLIQAVAESVP